MAAASYASAFFCAAVWGFLRLTGRRALNRIWRETWGLGAGLFAGLGLIFHWIGV